VADYRVIEALPHARSQVTVQEVAASSAIVLMAALAWPAIFRSAGAAIACLATFSRLAPDSGNVAGRSENDGFWVHLINRNSSNALRDSVDVNPALPFLESEGDTSSSGWHFAKGLDARPGRTIADGFQRVRTYIWDAL
jgi:hypothetical protein